MALPAMISGFGQQTANYGMSVGQSLAQLGQQVGQQLAMREYQKQAASALPAMQAEYESAFNKISQGDTAGGYMDVMKTNMNYGATQNPFLLPYISQASQFAESAAKNILSQGWQALQAGRSAGGGVPATAGMSGAQLAEQAALGIDSQTPLPEEGDVINFNQPTDATTTMDMIDQEAAAGLPATAGMTPSVQDAAAAGAAGQPFPFQGTAQAGPTKEAAQAQKSFAKLPVYKQAAVANVGAYNALPPQQKQQALQSAIASDPGAENYEKEAIDFGDFGIDVGEIGIPKVKEQVRVKMTASGTTKDATVRKTFSQDFIEVGKEQYKDNKEYVKKLREARNSLSKERPSPSLPTFQKIFQNNGGILNSTFSPNDDSETSKQFPFLMIPSEGASPIPITEKQYENIQAIQTLPANADSTGLNILPSKKKMEPAKKLSPMDQQALDWANANSNDPRAKQIKQKLGI
jgi:hypothetical protein